MNERVQGLKHCPPPTTHNYFEDWFGKKQEPVATCYSAIRHRSLSLMYQPPRSWAEQKGRKKHTAAPIAVSLPNWPRPPLCSLVLEKCWWSVSRCSLHPMASDQVRGEQRHP